MLTSAAGRKQLTATQFCQDSPRAGGDSEGEACVLSQLRSHRHTQHTDICRHSWLRCRAIVSRHKQNGLIWSDTFRIYIEPFYFFPLFERFFPPLAPPNAAPATLLTAGDDFLLLSNLLALRATFFDVTGFAMLTSYAAFSAIISASATSSVKSRISWNGSKFV
jgi:hypothetical protein